MVQISSLVLPTKGAAFVPSTRRGGIHRRRCNACRVLLFVALFIRLVLLYKYNYKNLTNWFPELELFHSFHDRCGSPPWVTNPSLLARFPAIDLADYPLYIVHGRPGPPHPLILEPLQQQNISFHVFRPPSPSPERLARYGRNPNISTPFHVGECRVTLAHRDVLREAFQGNHSNNSNNDNPQSTDSVIVMEDDAQLLEEHESELKRVLAYYEYSQLPFLSLFRSNQRCRRYLFSTVAYVMRREFYHKLLQDKTCLLQCSNGPIDVCMSQTYPYLQKTQTYVFHHGLMGSMKETSHQHPQS